MDLEKGHDQMAKLESRHDVVLVIDRTIMKGMLTRMIVGASVRDDYIHA
jgi:hypothetical protein